MDFSLSDEHELFRSTVRDFVNREIRPVAIEWEHSGRYPTEIVETMKQLGLFGLTVPEEYGGLGADLITLAIVFEEISRGWMGIAGILGSHSLSCFLIAKHGTEEQRRTYLPDLATGARRTGLALTEPDAGTDLQGIKTPGGPGRRRLRDPRHQDVDHQRPLRRPAPGAREDRSGGRSAPPGYERAAGGGRHTGLRGVT